jgi:hypothetical protein
MISAAAICKGFLVKSLSQSSLKSELIIAGKIAVISYLFCKCVNRDRRPERYPSRLAVITVLSLAASALIPYREFKVFEIQQKAFWASIFACIISGPQSAELWYKTYTTIFAVGFLLSRPG